MSWERETEFDESDEAIAMPPWAGAEVTREPRNFNTNLVRHPIENWKGTVSKEGEREMLRLVIFLLLVGIVLGLIARGLYLRRPKVRAAEHPNRPASGLSPAREIQGAPPLSARPVYRPPESDRAAHAERDRERVRKPET